MQFTDKLTVFVVGVSRCNVTWFQGTPHRLRCTDAATHMARCSRYKGSNKRDTYLVRGNRRFQEVRPPMISSLLVAVTGNILHILLSSLRFVTT